VPEVILPKDEFPMTLSRPLTARLLETLREPMVELEMVVVARVVLPVVVRVFRLVLPVEVALVQNRLVNQPLAAVKRFDQKEPVVVALVKVALVPIKFVTVIPVAFKLEMVVVAREEAPVAIIPVEVTL